MNEFENGPSTGKLDLLQKRVQRSFGDRSVADAIVRVRAIVGPGAIPDSEPLAQAALDKLHQGEVPDADELTALEMVIRIMRPVVYTRDGVLADLPRKPDQEIYPQERHDKWSAFRDKVAPLVSSIGRVERVAGGGSAEHIGTGFLVKNNVLATNRHVLGALTFGAELLREGSARVVFKQEYGVNNKPADIVRITGINAIHPHLDMVLLDVAPTDRPSISIDTSAPVAGDEVVAIGYPAEDKMNNPAFLKATFPRKFGLRCAALGEILDGISVPSFYHDCSTTQGNSGSPLFSLETAEVAGIHRAGFFMYRNEAIDGASLGEFVS